NHLQTLANPTRAPDAAFVLRRIPLRAKAEGRAVRDGARYVWRASGRRYGVDADLCERHFEGRTSRIGVADDRAIDRRLQYGVASGAPWPVTKSRTDVVIGCCRFRNGDDHLRNLAQFLAFNVNAQPARLLRQHQCRCPLHAGSDPHARRYARPRLRFERAIHRNIERTRRVRIRVGGEFFWPCFFSSLGRDRHVAHRAGNDLAISATEDIWPTGPTARPYGFRDET